MLVVRMCTPCPETSFNQELFPILKGQPSGFPASKLVIWELHGLKKDHVYIATHSLYTTLLVDVFTKTIIMEA